MMENLNKNAIYSAVCLVLAPIIFLVVTEIAFSLLSVSYQGALVDLSYQLTRTNLFLRYDLGSPLITLAQILAVISLILSAYFGIRSILANKGQERGRMLAVASTTIAIFLVVVAPILAFLF